jgi:23S rRNA pseudouridine2605 synthase
LSPSRKSLPTRPPAQTADRVQKVLAAAGLGSRREIEGWIAAGRVSVNGEVVTLGARAGPADQIAVDGKRVDRRKPEEPRVLLYHKPVGELVTRSDPQGRRTVFESLPPGRWIAVGRLDLNSAGLILFTDSGELANRLMHPRYGLEREYAARVRGELQPGERKRLLEGVAFDDGPPGRFERIETYREGEGANRWYRVVLKEGRNREVRRMFEALGHAVSRLTRLRYGPIELPEDLAPGHWRELRNPVILQKL